VDLPAPLRPISASEVLLRERQRDPAQRLLAARPGEAQISDLQQNGSGAHAPCTPPMPLRPRSAPTSDHDQPLRCRRGLLRQRWHGACGSRVRPSPARSDRRARPPAPSATRSAIRPLAASAPRPAHAPAAAHRRDHPPGLIGEHRDVRNRKAAEGSDRAGHAQRLRGAEQVPLRWWCPRAASPIEERQRGICRPRRPDRVHMRFEGLRVDGSTGAASRSSRAAGRARGSPGRFEDPARRAAERRRAHCHQQRARVGQQQVDCARPAPRRCRAPRPSARRRPASPAHQVDARASRVRPCVHQVV
jgi:hypothetical protein